MTALFHSLGALENPLGFGASDFVEVAFGLVLVLLALMWRPFLAPRLAPLASKTRRSMLVLAALPIVLRLLLLRIIRCRRPIFTMSFGISSVPDTLRHSRSRTPRILFHQFFKTFPFSTADLQLPLSQLAKD